MNQQALFNVTDTAPKRCSDPLCNTTRVNLCKWAADQALDRDLTVRRPRGCLNQIQGARPGFDNNGFPTTY